MSQSSGGSKAAPGKLALAERKQSVVITATLSPASAFGEDIADDAYSVSELSHVEEDKRAKRLAGQGGLATHADSSGREPFLRSTIGRGGAMRDRLQSFAEESQGTNESSSSPCSGQNGQVDPIEASSDASHERSPEGSRNDVTSAELDDIDLSTESSFAHFARTRFHLKGTTHAYCCSALPHPLLPKSDRADLLASLAAWVLILRIMGDLPDKDITEALLMPGEQPPVISVVRASFKTKYTKKDVEDAQAKYSELFKDPQGTVMQGVPFLPDKYDSMLEKVQYVICLGIYRPDLRDELYCQLCKQLTNNPSRNSTVRGWVLLSLFAGSFAPSEKFTTFFDHFLLEGPPELAQKVDRLVRRTCTVGTRGYPPSWLEFQAAKNNKPLLVPVTFMNGYRTLCEVDTASTVQELVHNIAEKIGLLDSRGYSIYVTLHAKISCLGHGMHRVMDAISECEQNTKQMGMRESNSLWRLFFRREYFSPWHVLNEDHVNTDLIYQQVMRGVALGEYKCEKEEVLILFAAQRYYIEHSDDDKFEKLNSFMKNWISEEMLQKHEQSYYVDKVRECLQTSFLNKPDHLSLKKDIVTFAKDKWFLLFSRFYDAPKVVGPGVALSRVVVALNNKGVYILDDNDTIRMHIAFWEVASVTKGRQMTTVRTLKGDDYVVNTNHSEDFFVMLTSFIHGLRMRSRYVVVTQDITRTENNGSNSSLVRGDLIILEKPYSETLDDQALRGMCKRTSAACECPRDKLYLLSVIEEPTGDILGRVMVQLRKDPTFLLTDVDCKPHTLQQYSRQNFRPISENAVTKLFHKASFKRDKSDALWQHSREPLKKPLLKRTSHREELKKPACRAFSAIQCYMGDIVVEKEVTDAELANEYILDPARRNKYLRDEIYCQLIKQLTNNPEKSSEERGWNLMALLCATATPHGELFDQCVGFLRGARNRQARACADLITAQKSSGSRLFPPHILEHDMVTKGQPNVRAQVMLPSGLSLTVEVGSRTRVSDIKREVKQRLRLQSSAEYSIFLTNTNSLHSLPDRSFYFDCLTQAENYWLKRSHKNTNTSSPTSGLVMLKKIWVNITPGIDPEADKSFHFPQEVPNFVRGYHKCTHQEVIQLAALLYRAKYASDSSKFDKFSEVAQAIIPRGFPEKGTLEDVRKEVEQEYKRTNGISQDEVRMRFLRVAVTWPTYGSVFFEVKQRISKTLPKYCLLAINTGGVHVSDLQTKEVLQTHEFTKIPNWAYDENSFTLIIMVNNGTSKLLLETNVGHNMDDVLMSHISWVMNNQMKRKHGFYNNVGESFC